MTIRHMRQPEVMSHCLLLRDRTPTSVKLWASAMDTWGLGQQSRIGSAIQNPSGTNVNWSTFITDYSWIGSLVTYYAKHPYSFSEPKTLQNGWRILSGPNYTAPSIPSADALGTYNTSYTGPGGLYNWLSLRNRAYPGWASNGSSIP